MEFNYFDKINTLNWILSLILKKEPGRSNANKPCVLGLETCTPYKFEVDKLKAIFTRVKKIYLQKQNAPANDEDISKLTNSEHTKRDAWQTTARVYFIFIRIHSGELVTVVMFGLTGVHALVRVQTGLLREALETEVALKRPLARVRAHVDLQVWLATKCCIAHLPQTSNTWQVSTQLQAFVARVALYQHNTGHRRPVSWSGFRMRPNSYSFFPF